MRRADIYGGEGGGGGRLSVDDDDGCYGVDGGGCGEGVGTTRLVVRMLSWVMVSVYVVSVTVGAVGRYDDGVRV